MPRGPPFLRLRSFFTGRPSVTMTVDPNNYTAGQKISTAMPGARLRAVTFAPNLEATQLLSIVQPVEAPLGCGS
jgi:hypothetical protein